MSVIGLITGTTGQDGSYMLDLLLEKNYIVWGIVRKSSSTNKMHNISHQLKNPNFIIRYGDLIDGNCIPNVISEIKITYSDLIRLEIYNFGAISHVGLSFQLPDLTITVNAVAVLRILEAIRTSGFSEKIRFLQASTSELYGGSTESPQNENTAFYPKSPYSCAKLYAFWITKNYRESYNLYACNSIGFNHDSSRRDEIFVTRKITKGLSDIIHGRSDKLILGNIHTFRDISHAKDCVKGMWQMLQQDIADDFVLCSGETHLLLSGKMKN
jgi:GDPmannose 4,6-dehydratase